MVIRCRTLCSTGTCRWPSSLAHSKPSNTPWTSLRGISSASRMAKVNSSRPRLFAPNRSVSRARPMRSLSSLQAVVVSTRTTTAARLMGNRPATQKKLARSLPCRASNTAPTDHPAPYMACRARAPLVLSLARRNLASAVVVESMKMQHLNAFKIVPKSRTHHRCVSRAPSEI